MNILLLGSGGREHALAWKLLQSARLEHLYFSTESGAIEALQSLYPQRVSRSPALSQNQVQLIEFAKIHQIDLVVIGPEAPLAAGMSDRLRSANVKVFGPSKAGMQLEASKAFAKDFMSRHQIPTAHYAVFREYATAWSYAKTVQQPLVIKASGLASGKGVFLPDSLEETKTILQALLKDRVLGAAGEEVVIEERLFGRELSLLCFTDGESWQVMPPARDYKRLRDGDHGPNTGGMGAYAPVKLPDTLTLEALSHQILAPTLAGLQQEKIDFSGVLYAGLILTEQGPKVLEFNCRFGDPEAQVLLPLLKTDLVDIVEACALPGRLKDLAITWHSQQAVGVVLASPHYPERSPTSPVAIQGWETSLPETLVFQAGTCYQNHQLWATGGRVLSVVALANTLASAVQQVYKQVENIAFLEAHYRRDIGIL